MILVERAVYVRNSSQLCLINTHITRNAQFSLSFRVVYSFRPAKEVNFLVVAVVKCIRIIETIIPTHYHHSPLLPKSTSTQLTPIDDSDSVQHFRDFTLAHPSSGYGTRLKGSRGGWEGQAAIVKTGDSREYRMPNNQTINYPPTLIDRDDTDYIQTKKSQNAP